MKLVKEQFIPLSLTVVVFLALCTLLYGFISILNVFPFHDKISLDIRKRDVLVGLTIYLKTAIDFAIFIGNVMVSNPGWKKRIAIEIGTAVGNGVGTIVVLLVWSFFREVPILMGIMIALASLVLLQMAEESLDDFLQGQKKSSLLVRLVKPIVGLLKNIGHVTHPILGFLLPNIKVTKAKKLQFLPLAIFAFTIPFVLGLDDFAGYIPLFSIINIFGFAIGVFLGHMILNIGLFLSPTRTTSLVRQPIVLLVGGLAFVGIAAWGFYEVVLLLLENIHL